MDNQSIKIKILLLSIILALVFGVIKTYAFVSLKPYNSKTLLSTSNCFNFSPYYKDGQDPRQESDISEEQIRQGLEAIEPYCDCIRTFSASEPLKKVATIAKEMGFTVFQGVWIDSDTLTNRIELNNGIELAQMGLVDRIVVGSETQLRKDVSPEVLIDYLDEVKKAVPSVPVTTADVYQQLIDNPEILNSVDWIYYNVYPFWESASLDECAMYNFHQAYECLKAVANGKELIISETGWPSNGSSFGTAIPSLENMIKYYQYVKSWSIQNQVDFFWFSAFSENWKGNEGDVGLHWGIFEFNEMTQELEIKEGMANALTEAIEVDSAIWTCHFLENETGLPKVQLTHVSGIGVRDGFITGIVDGIRPCDYFLFAAIRVNGRYYEKPFSDNKITRINCDGTFYLDYTTGGGDEHADQIVLLLLPKGTALPRVFFAPEIPQQLFEASVTQIVIERQAVEIEMEEVAGCIGDKIDIPVRVRHFLNVDSAEFEFTNINDELEFTGLGCLAEGGLAEVNLFNPEKLNFSIKAEANKCINIVDSILFTLQVKVLNNFNNKKYINLTNSKIFQQNLERSIESKANDESTTVSILTEGNCESSQCVDFIISSGVDLEGIVESVLVYPNPVKQGSLFHLDLKLKHQSQGTINVYNNLGQRIVERKHYLQQGSNKIQIKDQLPKGIYQILILLDNGLYTRNQLCIQ